MLFRSNAYYQGAVQSSGSGSPIISRMSGSDIKIYAAGNSQVSNANLSNAFVLISFFVGISQRNNALLTTTIKKAGIICSQPISTIRINREKAFVNRSLVLRFMKKEYLKTGITK